jgi:CHASE3 domain sensor protein
MSFFQNLANSLNKGVSNVTGAVGNTINSITNTGTGVINQLSGVNQSNLTAQQLQNQYNATIKQIEEEARLKALKNSPEAIAARQRTITIVTVFGLVLVAIIVWRITR